jgi:hypothetical protein
VKEKSCELSNMERPHTVEEKYDEKYFLRLAGRTEVIRNILVPRLEHER